MGDEKEFVSTATQTPSSWLTDERQKLYNESHGMPSLMEQEQALNLSGDIIAKQVQNQYFWSARRDDYRN
ncbi:hypothetical protein CEXT_788621 [Caerostris extrusa]|uniref:Uncharacterized protein n=1 Tax=Caerostris extrusa TaxID=172846 RepID=A0AAV4NRL5_CAEEX|nr:hypothetical protein CEXT_788621 [Caerostris extrusa]